MITLFVYPADEDWGQHELIDATLKGTRSPHFESGSQTNVGTVWFGSAAGNVATIDIAGVKSVDEIRQKIYEASINYKLTSSLWANPFS